MSIFIGSVYTFRKKYWVWFGAYMILDCGLWVVGCGWVYKPAMQCNAMQCNVELVVKQFEQLDGFRSLLYKTLKAKSMMVTELFTTAKLDQTEATKALNALVKKELIVPKF